jgi:catechol 2,3-dioxygenase-like lactoylglutathione lyase family enzyme
MTQIQVTGIDHIDLSVGNLGRSASFYETVLAALGYSRVSDETTIVWRNGSTEIGLRAAVRATAEPYDRFKTGLHHLAFRAKDRADIDRFYAFLLDRGLQILDPPADYPQYGDEYYAVFFADPDGIKLEVVYRG